MKQTPNQEHGGIMKERITASIGPMKIGRFWDLTFTFGKALSGICVLVFFLIFAFSLLSYVFGGAPGFKTPKFKDMQPILKGTFNQKASPDFMVTDNRLKVEQQFSDDIKELIEKYSFDQMSYDIFLNLLLDLPDDLRRYFIKGADIFIDRGLKYAKIYNKQKELNPAVLVNNYKEMFFANVEEWKQGQELSQFDKYEAIGIIAGSLLMFIVFLIIPLLIKIEENTRT